MPDDSTPLGAVGLSAGCPYFFVVAYTLSPALPHPSKLSQHTQSLPYPTESVSLTSSKNESPFGTF